MERLTMNKKLFDLMTIIEKMGPDESEYPIINKLVESIKNEEDEQLFRDLATPMLDQSTLLGHGFVKPFGYAGDYLLIEKIYKKYISEDVRYYKWDKYYHSLEAASAVRNRKTYFVKTMQQLCFRKSGALQVLILGSGPATDVHEFLCKKPDADVTFDLLDIDQRAIDYASDKNKKFLSKINFVRMNVLRFAPDKKYDLIWSAGLFDYLNDRIFTGLLNRYKNNLKKDGEMIIGNFSPLNPTRKVMEIICQWYLIHRTSQQLRQLAVKAGIHRHIIEVDKEPLGINLFLRIKPDKLKVSLQNVSSLQHSEKSDL